MTDAVLVMAYGSPARPEDIPAYYTHIRGGRPPRAEEIADLEARYRAIGGTSPLRRITAAQVDALRAALAARYPEPLPVVLGYKHAAPTIEDAAAELRAAGAERVVGLVLAPHDSGMGVGAYHQRAAAALGDVTYLPVRSWHARAGFVQLWADALTAVLPEDRGHSHVLFTAHSLPARIVTEGDPYPREVQASAAAVAAAAAVDRWSLAWQSAGRGGGPWLGPDILEVIEVLAARADPPVRTVVVCPIGFVADHLEVLYDIDIAARAQAERVGVELRRTPMPNDDPRLAAVLAEVVIDRLEGR